MRILVIILTLILSASCSNYSDKELINKYYKNNIDFESVVQDSIENTITRYDDLGYPIDKHWFDKNDNLFLYTFYNRFHETNKAALKIKFNEKGNITEFKGKPFYLSSNLYAKDSLIIDTVKAYMYLANSPILNPEVKILTNNSTTNEKYIIDKKSPNYVIYFEDYPDITLQNIKYTFHYTLKVADYIYSDSLVHNCYLKSQ